ncbi:hypothetical protein BGW80DRAFT_1248836 [Lactifluus volemus]|nr:hypothetical protein BGW80DRAFT_1248836 [Lactifluus volemus]
MGPHSDTSDPHSRAVVIALYNDPFTIPVATLGHSLHKLRLPPAVSCFISQGAYLPVHFCTARAAGWEPLEIELGLTTPTLHNGTGIGSRFVDQYTRPLSQLEHTFYLWLKTLKSSFVSFSLVCAHAHGPASKHPQLGDSHQIDASKAYYYQPVDGN